MFYLRLAAICGECNLSTTSEIREEVQYQFEGAGHAPSHNYLLGPVGELLAEVQPKKVFDLGCGNGSVLNHFSQKYTVAGIDASSTGIKNAKEKYPHLDIEQGSAYDDLVSKFGEQDAVISLEVVEHLYDPRLYAKRLFDLIRPGGHAVLSTPYHGYLKNLALAVTGKMDNHFTALWDGGHIKFWSVRTLSILLEEAGFTELEYHRVGRIPPLAKSMIVRAKKPNA